MGSSDSKLAEFVSLSKCLPTFLGQYDAEPNAAVAPRSKLALSITQRMQLLIDSMEVPVSSEKPTTRRFDVKTVPPGNYPDAQGNQGPPLHVEGARVLTEDAKLEAERQLVADRVLQVLVDKIDNLKPSDAPGTMIELALDPENEEHLIQAYIIPDTAGNTEAPKLQIFRYRLLLSAAE